MHTLTNEISFIKSLQLAADARLSKVNYTDDHIWDWVFEDEKLAPLTLRTRYGGRVGRVSLIPQWIHSGRTIGTPQTYAKAPRLTAFAPAFARAEGAITSTLSLIAEYWVMESNAVGGRFTISNTGAVSETLELSLMGDILHDKKTDLAIITLISQSHALSLGRYANLEPIVMLENAQAKAQSGKAQPIITSKLTIEAGQSVRVRFVHAGLNRMGDSLNRAMYWLEQNWDEAFATIEKASQSIPSIQTGDANLDTLIALSYHHLLQAFISPTNTLPHASFVATRQSERGYSARGDGNDFDRSWNGQPAHLAYLVSLAISPISAELAQGVLKNFLATQTHDGKVEIKPSLAPQPPSERHLCPPILARMAWHIYQYTEDRTFLEETFPKLLRFYQKWVESDIDQDAMPEWEHERQMGYVFFPTFGNNQAWAQNVDIRITESPDMATYMISETIYLSYISHVLGKTDGYGLLNKITKLQAFLEKLWRESLGRYSYQDRDTDLATPYIPIFMELPADERVPVALSLEDAARIQVHLIGGTSQAPKATLHITGTAPNGDPLHERADVKSHFIWGYGNGFYTSRNLFKTVDEVYFEGVSRVYKFTAHTVDFSRPDINGLLPLALEGIPENRAESLIKLLTDPAQFWRKSGMSIVSAKDPNYDPSSAVGGGGVWSYWTTLIGEGLIEYGRADITTQMIQNLLKTQLTAYQANGYFSEFYHSDQPQGCGEKHHLGGIVPLYLLNRVLGIQIFDERRVFVSGKLFWGREITITQHGVTINRTNDEAHITFPSGYTTTITIKDAGEVVEDTNAPIIPKMPMEPHFPPQLDAPNETKRVIIQVDIEPDEPIS
ncbi:MAG: hypothetical protein MUE54_00290 [Anaerolineae bacterium]|nr:hypothetical protein [Anaerolineae bacterium]